MSVVRLHKNNFEAEILNRRGLSLVLFYAPWCSPCQMLSPTIREIAGEYPEIAVGEVNIDWHPKFTAQQGVESVPTLIIFRDGQELTRMTGCQMKEDILMVLNGFQSSSQY